jgi:azurin
MKMNVRLTMFALMVGAALVLSACGNNNAGGNTAGGGGSTATTIDIGSAGENLAFDKTALTASAGAPVVVKFKNNSAAQQHNWVLVNGGTDVAAKIAADGLTAGAAAEFLPADKANIVANTKLLNGGETGEVSFTAPAAGTYEFICTAPGHYPLMKGTLTVN